MAGAAVPNPLTNDQKVHWNNFVDYLQKTGYKGSKALDNRNMAMGENLLAKFNQMNPGSQIRYEDVPMVQSELQKYRQDLVNRWKSGKAEGTPDIKTEDDIMPGISQVDGWLGSKTSSYKFPTAVVTQSDGNKVNYGVDTKLYDAYMAAKNKQK